MNKDLGRRLARLDEAKAASASVLSPWRVLFPAVGFLIGRPNGSQSIAESVAPVLGYASPRDLRAAMMEEDGSDGFNARWEREVAGLCHEHGLDPGTVDLTEFIALVERLLREHREGSQRNAWPDGLEFPGRELTEAAT